MYTHTNEWTGLKKFSGKSYTQRKKKENRMGDRAWKHKCEHFQLALNGKWTNTWARLKYFFLKNKLLTSWLMERINLVANMQFKGEKNFDDQIGEIPDRSRERDWRTHAMMKWNCSKNRMHSSKCTILSGLNQSNKLQVIKPIKQSNNVSNLMKAKMIIVNLKYHLIAMNCLN